MTSLLLRVGMIGLLSAIAALLLWEAPGAAQAAGIEVVLSEESGVYVELAERLRDDLAPHELHRVSAAALERDGPTGLAPDLVIALGTRALTAASARHSAPILGALVPMDTFERVLRAAQRPRNAKPISGVYLDQPARRRLDLVRLVLPGKDRVGVLASSEKDPDLRQLRDAAASAALSVVSEQVGSAHRLYPALSRLLADADVVLATPDPAIFNSGNIHNIMLATYRARVPVIGFSAAYVQAGALAAIYSTPSQISPQLADLALRALGGRSLPPPQYPRGFSVGVNQTVARSLGLSLEEGTALEARLSALEAEP